MFNVWGSGEGQKDYSYIEEFCKILFYLLQHNWEDYRVLNIGSGELLSVNTIVNCINRLCPGFQWNYEKSNILDVQDFKLNLDKLHNLVDFKCTTIEEGLNKTKQWYDGRIKNSMVILNFIFLMFIFIQFSIFHFLEFVNY